MEQTLQRILADPSPDDLWALQPCLLALNTPDAAIARELAQQFYGYLSAVRSKLTSKQYSLFAATLAAGSIGVVSLGDVVRTAATDRPHVIRDLLVGGLAATLETFSTFQHVKAWETDFAAVHDEAVWFLYASLWRLSTEYQPDLPPGERHTLIDRLLAIARDSSANSAARMALIIRLFQLLLVIRLMPLLLRAAVTTAEME